MRLKIAIFTGLLAGYLISFPAFAAIAPPPAGGPTPECQPLYNGGDFCKENPSLTINKKVLKPGALKTGSSFSDNDFIENINPTDTRYPANATTAFRIFITNTTNQPLKNILVKDIFPAHFLTFVSGSGTYDDTTRTFSTTISELKAKESKQITINVMTARPDELPKEDTSLCTINLGIATVGNKESQDSAQICVTREEQLTSPLSVPAKSLQNPAVTKGGLPIVSPATSQTAKSTPKTGPESLILVGLIPTGLFGLLLRKKTS